MNIYIPNINKLITYSKKAFEERGVYLIENVHDTVDEKKQKLYDAEVLIANFITLDAQSIDCLPNLRHIIVPATGYDWVDAVHAQSRNITVSNCPFFSINTVAEHAVMLLLTCLRAVPDADKIPLTLTKKTVGFIGYGQIAKQINRILSGFEITSKYINTSKDANEIIEVVSNSDILISTLPSTAETKNYVSRDFLGLVKSGCVFVNVGRGETVDEDALMESLIAGRVRSAGIDVVKNEHTSSISTSRLLSLPQVVHTPHIAYLSEQAILTRDTELLYAIDSCLSGNPVNLIY